jgi:hypothetical protein
VSSEILLSIGSAAAAAAAAIVSSLLYSGLKSLLLPKPTSAPEPYGEKLRRLFSSVEEASHSIDETLKEMIAVTSQREATVHALSETLRELEEKEGTIRSRIDALNNTPIEVAEHFATLVHSSERRSARRDYILFGAGAVLTALISVVLSLLGVG